MGRAGVWQVEPAPIIGAPWALRQEAWCRPARRWATVTPFVFDRFPDDLYGEEAEEIVRTACARVISMPDGQPCRPTHITLLPVSAHIGVPASHAFPRAPARPGKPSRCQLHVILDFEHRVHGPFAIGAGRYYGYGLCRAINH
ncbi:MAG: type I-U CRISPR-associated protein Cas5/Cas6 [Acidobacteriaceae bacterium]|nr:type I-U CRISPR-associated protein Cas5/Cas6 [Acidobacteriaceae bacterium]